jgi:dihydroorotate dehydrogenase
MRPALFALEAETAHHVTLASLRTLQRVGLLRAHSSDAARCSKSVMGITFPNPVGLAAGLDKNGAYIDALAALGFGFIEIGTVTPRPQPGNPRPRLFRVQQAHAIINRMGFNNEGVDRVVENVRSSSYTGVLGINIGKNFDTPLERALDDYIACLQRVYEFATYITINISSPNTKGLRDLQTSRALDALLAGLAAERRKLMDQHSKRVPLALKIAPDLDDGEISAIADLLRQYSVDAVIATNTTVARDGVANLVHADEAGGLSGAPLKAKATRIVSALARALGSDIPVIGVGGIMSGTDALEKIDAGARLVQLYTGLIYRGPRLVRECISALCDKTGTAAAGAQGQWR